MMKWIYKKILEKINLSKNELLLLRQKLKKEDISYGPFIQDKKMCQTTTALSIKMGKRFKEDREVIKALNKIGINKMPINGSDDITVSDHLLITTDHLAFDK